MYRMLNPALMQDSLYITKRLPPKDLNDNQFNFNLICAQHFSLSRPLPSAQPLLQH